MKDGVAGSGVHSITGYRVEVSFKPDAVIKNIPIVIGQGPLPRILTERWAEIDTVDASDGGVPNDLPHGVEHRLFSHASAMALAHMFIARNNRHGVQARLVKYDLSVSYTITKKGVVVGGPIQGLGYRDIEVVEPPTAQQQDAKEGG